MVVVLLEDLLADVDPLQVESRCLDRLAVVHSCRHHWVARHQLGFFQGHRLDAQEELLAHAVAPVVVVVALVDTTVKDPGCSEVELKNRPFLTIR